MNATRAMVLGLMSVAGMCAALPDASSAEPLKNPAPSAKDWADIAKLPDFSGTWVPDIDDQNRQMKSNPTPWNPVAQKKVDKQFADDKAGRPYLVFPDCLPESHPSWMLISHNAMEILPTPGRVTLLGESDSNRLRRIYTDGRGHPKDVDESFQGHSIGHWEGDTLVVDTIGIYPQEPLAISEAVGIPNNGDMHVVERIHVKGDTLYFDLEITAPKILTRPWKTTRIWYRKRERDFEVVEGTCVSGQFAPSVNAEGDHVRVRLEFDEHGAPIPPK